MKNVIYTNSYFSSSLEARNTKITPIDNCIQIFNEASFCEILQIKSLDKKDLVRYLYEYLQKINAQTMVLESKYTDKYYLDDYLHFYATCHHSYERFCKRIHFFRDEITNDDIVSSDAIAKNKMRGSYLGCIVIKPISTFIGRTLISTYPDTNSDPLMGDQLGCRHIITLRKNTVNLFGNELEITSLSFQEQDQIISACATTALWTVLCPCFSHYCASKNTRIYHPRISRNSEQSF